MRSYRNPALMLTALSAFITLAASPASAQQSQTSEIPTFASEVPAARPDDESAQKPAAPAPALVLRAGEPVSGEPEVLPPAPRILAAAAGSVAVPNRGAIEGYRAQAIVATSLKVNSAYGPRRGRRHTGIDYEGDWGQSVGASMDGTIAFAGVKRGYGNLIVVDHGRGVSTYYAHLSSMYVAEGQAVKARQIIGAIGSTGRSSGPHLHYEVRIDGHPINPTSLISFAGGVTHVNGVPFYGGEDGEETGDELAPAAAPVSSTGDAVRPRRVQQQPAVIKMPGVIYVGESKMSTAE